MDNAQRKLETKLQIELRLKLLKDVANGELDIDIPMSLSKLRVWENNQLGVKKIGSSSSFVTTHREYGRYVTKIYKLIGQIKKPKRSKSKSVSKKLLDVTKENKKLKNLLQETTNQYVMMSSQIKMLKDDAVLTNSMEEGYKEELRELQERLVEAQRNISHLRKAVIKSTGGSSSKVTEVDFGKED